VPLDNASENDVQRQIAVGFDISDPWLALYNPIQSLAMDLQPSSEVRPWSLRSTSSYGNSDLGLHAPIVDFSPLTCQDIQSLDTYLESDRSLATKRGSSQLNVLETLSPPKRAKMSAYRDIVSKPAASPTEVIGRIGSSNAESQEPKKGCRHGPLGAEQRQKAYKMRGRRACAPCYTSHIAVSGEPCIG
jgi:hypothetical protein